MQVDGMRDQAAIISQSEFNSVTLPDADHRPRYFPVECPIFVRCSKNRIELSFQLLRYERNSDDLQRTAAGRWRNVCGIANDIHCVLSLVGCWLLRPANRRHYVR